jgi:hypothetical protein
MVPPQPQIVFVLNDGQKTFLCMGQLIYDAGEPYAIPNDPIPGHPRIKLIATRIERQDDHTLGLVWYIYRELVFRGP